MRILELFSGSQSVGKVARELGWEVVSLDIDDYKGQHAPTIKTDIMEWDYKEAYAPKHFDVVWASPPCIYYAASLQRCNLGRRLKDGTIWTQERWDEKILLADEWVKRALEIIDYFEPARWYLENSGMGLLKTRPFMAQYSEDCFLVDYCRYSDWGYRKRTRVYTNVKKGFEPLLCNKKCGNMEGRRHRLRTDNGKGSIAGTRTMLRYRIPPKLIKALFV